MDGRFGMLVDVRKAVHEMLGSEVSLIDLKVNRPDKLVAVVKVPYHRVVVKAVQGSRGHLCDIRGIRHIGRANVSVQEVLAQQYGVSVSGEPVHVMVLSYVPGEPLSACSPWEAQKEVGAVLRKIHALETTVFEESYPWRERFQRWLEKDMAWWCDGNGEDEDKVGMVRKHMEGLWEDLALRGNETVLVDGRPEHIRMHHGHFSGLIDLEDVWRGDWIMDFAVLAMNNERVVEGVKNGYGMSSEEDDEFAKFLPLYVFLRRLSAARWNMENGSPARAYSFLHDVDTHLIPG